MKTPSEYSVEKNKIIQDAIILYNSGMLNDALELYQRAEAFSKKDKDLYFAIARIQRQLKNLKDSLLNINKAIKLDGSQLNFYFERALIRSDLKQFANALDDLGFILKSDRSNHVVMSAISTIHYKQGDYGKALQWLEQALERQPAAFNYIFNKAKIFEALKQFENALSMYFKCLSIKPDDPECLNNIGFVYLQLPNFEEGKSFFIKAIEADPNYLEAKYNLANEFLRKKEYDDAIAQFNHILKRDPRFIAAYNNRGLAYLALKQYDEAIRSFESALAQEPNFVDAYINLGKALKETLEFSKAAECFNKAISIDPKSIEALKARGVLFNFTTHYQSALDDLNRAIQLNPNDAEAHCALADTFTAMNLIEAALVEYDRAIEIEPDYSEAFWNRSLLFLLKGEYEIGFRDYEWRKKTGEFKRRNLDPASELTPGADLQSKTLFIYPELYLGDLIQFSRFGLLAISRGAKVTIAAPKTMHSLLRTISHEFSLIGKDDVPEQFDYHCALMSLPYALSLTERSIPFGSGYIKSDPDLVEQWSKLIGSTGFKIGICWQGSTLPYSIPLRRSVHLSNFRKISQIPGVRLISLQRFDGLEQLNEIPDDMKIETLGSDIDAGGRAFIDTSAILSCLDLIISVDTATAHLAGALGRPTWLVLKDAPDWRWMLERTDSPWYETMRLFRNKSSHDWTELFEELAGELENYIKELT